MGEVRGESKFCLMTLQQQEMEILSTGMFVIPWWDEESVSFFKKLKIMMFLLQNKPC